MEEYLHISEVTNRESILKYGLLPHTPSLEHHSLCFMSNGWFKNMDDKILYMWLSCDKNDKYIKDGVYYQTWIKPRNKFHDPDLPLYVKGIYNNVNLYHSSEMLFDIWLVKSNSELYKKENRGRDLHYQEPAESIRSSLYKMHEEYAHDDKELALSLDIEKDITLIKQAKYEYNVKTRKFSIKILKEVI